MDGIKLSELERPTMDLALFLRPVLSKPRRLGAKNVSILEASIVYILSL